MDQDTSEAAFPVIGVGVGAEGLQALQTLLAHTPAGSGMAFVVIVHPAPGPALAAALQPHTSMPVIDVQEPLALAPGQILLIPPDRLPVLRDGVLHPLPDETPAGQRAPVDRLFGALAEHYAVRAGALVLAGAGSDGALGIQRVKESGGLTLAQEPREAEAGAMPRAAIATGMVDLVRPAAELPGALDHYWRNTRQVGLPAEAPRDDPAHGALRDILAVVRARTGHDFGPYKRTVLLRQIGRRMHLTGTGSLVAYLQLLRAWPEEIPALVRDLLIGVTSFFRDGPVWVALHGLLAQLFAGKTTGTQLRVWVPGCATGAEAYSVAMLLLDYARSLDAPPDIQVFATDVNEEAITKARQGRYPLTIAADVPQSYLERFFHQEQTHYRVSEELREVVLFAVHDLLHDPPFSLLDLITCRNLLIYLDTQAQEQVLSLFHYTLRPGGYLLLGTSETADVAQQRFAPIDSAHRLYQRHSLAPALLPVAPVLPLSDPATRRPLAAQPLPEEVRSLDELNKEVLAQYGPPSLIVNESFEILHLGQGASRFLQFRSGEPSYNLLLLIHPALRLGLRPALFNAVRQGTRSEATNLPVELDGVTRLVSIVVQPVSRPAWARGVLLVLFYDQGLAGPTTPASTSQVEALVRHVEEDLQRTRLLLQVRVEQYETVVEEYKAANEELQALNEELQTSKEQLQALNEELLTVNGELRYKVGELAQTNNDLQNLIDATAIPTLFVDRRLLVTRYTPAALELFNLIAADLHRPLAHITHGLHYPELLADARLVLLNAEPVEREVRDNANRFFLARLHPYRTSTSEADGVVLSFVEISARKHAEEAVAADLRDTHLLRDLATRLASEDDIHALYDQILEAAITLTGADAGTIQRYNPQTEQLELLRTRQLPAHLAEHFARIDAASTTSCGLSLATGERSFVDFDAPDAPDPDGSLRLHREAGFASAQSTPLITRSGRRIGMVSTHWRTRYRPSERELRFLDLLARQVADLLDQRQADAALREREEFLRLITENLPVLIGYHDREQRYRFVNAAFPAFFGVPREQILGRTIREQVGEQVYARLRPGIERALAGEIVRFEDKEPDRHGPGRHSWTEENYIPRFAADGTVEGFFVLAIDITDRKSATAGLALLADFSERLALLSSPAEIVHAFGQQFGVAFGASVCALLELDPASGEAVVLEHWLRDGARPTGGRFAVAGYLDSELEGLLAAGQPLVVHDVAADPRIRDKAAFAARRVGAFAHVPLLRDGAWRFLLGVYHAQPYPWDEDGIALLAEAAARIWSKLERLRAEAALRESEARFRLMVEGARDYAMFLLDPGNRITFWSSGAERIFGWSEAEARGQSGELIFTAEDRARGEAEREVQTALREGRALDRRWHIRNDGSRLFVDGALIRLDGQDGTMRGFVKIGRDATAQHEAEEALRQARDELERRVAERTADLAATNRALEQEIAERRQIEAERAALLQRLITAQEDERGRIARELHDSLGQFLTALSVRLGTLQSQVDGQTALSASLTELRRTAGQIDTELDRLTVELRPPILDDIGLVDALGSYTSEWTATSGVPVDIFTVRFDGARLPPAIEAAVFRIVQEALTNVLKHAQASRVSVILERRPDALRVIIEDDGQGFRTEATKPELAGGRRLGLLGMRERATLAGGTLAIESTPGEGTSIYLSIPLDEGR